MIIPEQLRIGNWVYNPAIRTNMQLYPMMIPRLHRIVSERGQPNIEPIPITEDILLKCGFTKKTSFNGDDFFEHKQLDFILDCDFQPEEYGFKVLKYKLEYIHQLQNLYFSLTGQELEIKL